MASKRLLCLFTLTAFSALAQIGNRITVYQTPSRASIPSLRFELRPGSGSTARMSIGSNVRGTGRDFVTAHRYFVDRDTHTYFGYDVIVRPDAQAGSYRVTFYELSIGPLDFATGADTPDPSQWKKLALPALPPEAVIQAGDNIEVTVLDDPSSGRKLVDVMSLAPGTPAVMLQTAMQSLAQFRNINAVSAEPPTVSGEARAFSIDDAEMHIQRARVIVNGAAQESALISRAVSGQLVWLYVPNHGRYILSLAPRADLGFVQAGEVRGGVVTFNIDKDLVRLESPVAIAPGDAPYLLYVLHDADWAPTSDRQGSTPLLGTVSPRELAALRRK